MDKKNILCAIDFSASSLQALKWSLKMAQLTKAQVTILFCYRLIATGDDEETLDLKKNIEHDAIMRFKEIESNLIIDKVPPYQFITEVGFFPVRIEMFVRNGPIGLLVLGNSLVANFNEYKSLNFEQFLLKSKVPVVVVPEESKDLIQIN
jgi:Universal stress protein family